MLSVNKMEEIMSLLLLCGTACAAGFVCIGGLFFLMQHGMDNIQVEILQTTPLQISHQELWQFALSFTPLGLIELGLLLLVLTQIIRVALLCGFYAAIRDYWFTVICTFILFVLVYSLFWRT